MMPVNTTWYDQFLKESLQYLTLLQRAETKLTTDFWSNIQNLSRQVEGINFDVVLKALSAPQISQDIAFKKGTCLIIYKLLTHNNPGLIPNFYVPRQELLQVNKDKDALNCVSFLIK